MTVLFKYNLNGIIGSLELTRGQYEGLCKLREDLYRSGKGSLELTEFMYIDYSEIIRNIFKKIIKNTLEKFPKYSKEQITDAIKYTFYHRYECLAFLYQELEGIESLTEEQIESAIRRQKFEEALLTI